MSKAIKQTAQEQVAEYLNKLDHPLKNVVDALRKIILATDIAISEQIKWNAPAFYYTGAMQSFDPKEYKRDIVVFNLYKKDFILLVFPTGATDDDRTGLLEGAFADSRKIAKFSTLEQVAARKNDLQTVVRIWLQQVDK